MTSPWELSKAMAAHRPGDWIMDALCAQIGPIDFFPGKSESAEPAKRVCRMCSVRRDCAEYALTSPTPLHGIWGGMSVTERREIRRVNGIRDEDLFEDWHGTEAGARRHYREGGVPCGPCRRAANEVARERERRQREAM